MAASELNERDSPGIGDDEYEHDSLSQSPGSSHEDGGSDSPRVLYGSAPSTTGRPSGFAGVPGLRLPIGPSTPGSFPPGSLVQNGPVQASDYYCPPVRLAADWHGKVLSNSDPNC